MMSKNYCTFIPSRGADVFDKLKKAYGYSIARKVFLRAAVNRKFQKEFSDTITLTSEGVVSFDSLMSNKLVQEYLGKEKVIEGLNKQFTPVDDDYLNYKAALEEAKAFNETSEVKDKYIATVEYTQDGKIKTTIQERTQQAIDRFNDQYSTTMLNDRLASMFKDVGVTVGYLSVAEQRAGRIGVTDFSNAKEVANGFVTLIRVANNMEGANALTEEFAHMIIGIFRESPLIERCIDTLLHNESAMRDILGDDFEDVCLFYSDETGNVDYSKVAEEALGHVLRRNLTKNVDNVSTPSPGLFKRAINWILSLFKNFSDRDIQNIIIDVDTSMDNLAKEILRGTKKITRSDVIKSQRDAQFNALSDRIDRGINILKSVKENEQKRDVITHGKIASIQMTIDDISAHMNNTDVAIGICNYAKGALTKCKGLSAALDQIESGNYPKEKVFDTLRLVNGYIHSYMPFINEMLDFLRTEEAEADNLFKDTEIKAIISELNNLSTNLGRRFLDIAVPAFTEFLRPFMGKSFTIPSGDRAGEIVTVDDIVKEAKNGDISLMDMWLDSAANTSDTFVQLINAAIQQQKHYARIETLDYFKDIQALRMKAERMGITTFDWMFERDANGNKTGNYVSPVNQGEFDRQRALMEAELEEKYGKNPTGEDALKKLAERRQWRKDNCTSEYGPMIPNPKKYKGKKLTDNQQSILDEFLVIKKQLDNKYPQSRVQINKAIQKRKSGRQRMLENITSPSAIFENIKESVSSALLEREDDDSLFGDNAVSRGLQDFDGREYLTLPALYTTRLKNPNELDDDVFGTLMSYAWTTCHYEAMESIVDPLEVGRIIAEERGKRTQKRRGSKPLVERINHKGEIITRVINEDGSNTARKISELLETQVYGRYLKGGGSLEVLGKRVSGNKFASQLLKWSSLTQLGLNWIANIANVATGLCMQNIEAVARQYYTAGDLAKADKTYLEAMPAFMNELGARTKNSPLALFCNLLDVKQDFGSRAKRAKQRKNLLLRIFGESIAFLGQTAGDHWLYTRTALAMAQKVDVYVNGKKMNLWEACKAATKEKGGVKYIDTSMMKDADGVPIDIFKIQESIKKVNQRCFGIYNEDDANMANRIALGRLLQQYRKWMKVQYNARFQAGQQDIRTDTWDEGYYRTLGRIGWELLRGERTIGNMHLSEDEEYNIRRALFEMLQTFAVFALANFVKWPDDKNRPYLLKLAELSTRRLAHELGGLTPSTVMPRELLKTVRSPMPVASWGLDMFNVINSAMTPSDYVEELQSGPYKGYTKLEKNLIKAPIPAAAWYRQLQKFNGDLDPTIQYYLRPSVY